MKATRNTVWRPGVGFEGRYEISNDGQVKVLAGEGRGRFNRDRILKVGRDGPGYKIAALYPGNGGKPTARRVHLLVLEAFVGPRPDGAFGRHLDDDRDNNTVQNLAWGDQSENTYDMVRNGNHNHARKTHCKSGHPLAGDNLIQTARQRACRVCARRRNAEYRGRKRALAVYAADLTKDDSDG